MGDEAEAPLLQDKDKDNDALKEVDKPQVGTFATLVHLMASDASLLFVAFCAGRPRARVLSQMYKAKGPLVRPQNTWFSAPTL